MAALAVIFLGWQYALALLLGARILIMLIAVFVRVAEPTGLAQRARRRAEQVSGMEMGPGEGLPERLADRARDERACQRMGRAYFGEWPMVYKELIAGLLARSYGWRFALYLGVLFSAAAAVATEIGILGLSRWSASCPAERAVSRRWRSSPSTTPSGSTSSPRPCGVDVPADVGDTVADSHRRVNRATRTRTVAATAARTARMPKGL